MKAVVMNEYGGPEVLKFYRLSGPTPGPGEVRIRVAAASGNPIDLLQRSGATKDFFPVEFNGSLAGMSPAPSSSSEPDSTNFPSATRSSLWRSIATRSFVSSRQIFSQRYWTTLTWLKAAALPLFTITGNQLISIASAIRSAQTVLVSGALGSVGRAAIYTAKEKGARVIAGVRKSQLAETKGPNADRMVALDDDAAFDALAPVDVVGNTVRGTTSALLLDKVRYGGTYASVTGVPDSAKSRLSVHAVAFDSKQDPKTRLYMAEAVRNGRLQIPISQKLRLEDAQQGHIAMEKGIAGKIFSSRE